MTENEDQIAQYRLKLEETAALVARIRHEINNPLTGVLGQAQLLLREDLSERSCKRVQTIEDLALRLRDVVAQLREVQNRAARTARKFEEAGATAQEHSTCSCHLLLLSVLTPAACVHDRNYFTPTKESRSRREPDKLIACCRCCFQHFFLHR